ncbi:MULTISPECIES: DUF2306 domain-containing protein [Luteimonas]|uniref:DUF2306 domain-containing protein n=1 Tax=Luteimonas TaxID=83614 RepID=UPI000C7A7B00|nr:MULTISPECIES: DUF2306 domain-containing protein [Luteimonas]
MDAPASSAFAPVVPERRLDTGLRWSARLLVATSWIGGAVFAAYIVVFFGGAALGGDAQRWNASLPGLFDAATPLAALAIGAHFLAGAVLLLLGPVQLIGRVRRRMPALHRGLGRVYVVAAGLAGVGGLGFIVARGTIGGAVMDIGFGLYGVLMVLCASLAFVHARAGRFERHRAWAIRLFALTVGSWLYRMEYGAWFLLTGGLGVGPAFTGGFDQVMAFFFYLPNLVIAELCIRARQRVRGAFAALASTATLVVASGIVVVVTAAFARGAWGHRVSSGLQALTS